MSNIQHQNPNKRLPSQGERFILGGNEAFLLMPEQTRANEPIPWVWYAPTLANYPGPEEKWMFEQFLDNGIAIAGIDVGESYGSPTGRKIFTKLYDELLEDHGFEEKANLLARSRGGLMLYNWAAENPTRVRSIAGIYPVCNIASYPGIDKACDAYEMTADELTKVLHQHNPIDRLEPLAKEGIPIFHIHGDNDTTVPLQENSAELARRYKKLGGEIILEIIKDGGHDMSTSWFQNQNLVDFIIKQSS